MSLISFKNLTFKPTFQQTKLFSSRSSNISGSSPFKLLYSKFYRNFSTNEAKQSRSKAPGDIAEEKLLKAKLLPKEFQKNIPSRPTMENVKHIIVVSSAKGGVGKSTIAVNLAIALSQLKKTVALLDADIYGPSLPILMNLRAQRPDVNRKRLLIPLMSYGIKCMSMGFLVPEDSAAIWRGPMVMGALEQMLTQTEWGDVDVMVMDLPPGTGDIQLSIAQSVAVSGAVVVCTPQALALYDAVRGINMFRKVNIPIFGLIENMSYYLCNCGEKSYIFGKGGAKRTAEEMKVDFLGEIPLVEYIRESSDDGSPITVSEPESKYSLIFKEMAQKLDQKLSASKAKGNPKIIIE